MHAIALLCAYMAFICGCMACIWRVYGGVYRGLYGHGLWLGIRDRRVGVACVVGCVYGVYTVLRRSLSVGYGVYVW